MPVPTMEKTDVKLSYASLSAVNWDEIRTLCGRAAPSTAKALHDEVRKKFNAKTVKKPYVKVGLIKGHLFIRYKDGTSHLGDVLLARDWNAPAPTVDTDPQVARRTHEYIEERKALEETVLVGKRILKQYQLQLADYKTELDGLARAAQEARKRKAAPDPKAPQRAADLDRTARKLQEMGHAQMDDKIFPPFAKHRTVTIPDGVDPQAADGWGKNFYLKVGTEFSKASEYLRMIDATAEHIAHAAQQVIAWTQEGADALALYRQQAQALAQQVHGELEAMQAALAGTHAIDQMSRHFLERTLPDVRENLDKGEDRLALGMVDACTTKMNKAAQAFKMMGKRHARLTQLAQGAAKLPKEAAKDATVAKLLKAIDDDVKAAKLFARTQQDFLEQGMSAYKEVRKAVSAGVAA